MGEIYEPITQAIVNSRDSAIGDRVIGPVAVLAFAVPLTVIVGYFGYQPYGAAKILSCFVFSGIITFFTIRFIRKVNRKRIATLEKEIREAKETETQRQLAEMRRKN